MTRKYVVSRLALVVVITGCAAHPGNPAEILQQDCQVCHSVQGITARIPHSGSAVGCSCHTVASWSEGIHYEHGENWLLQAGVHPEQSCYDCHADGFSTTSAECRTCHQDAANAAALDHSGQPLNGSCDDCHSQQAWLPVDASFHSSLFPLTGNHAVSCASCHTTSDPKSFVCTDCHAHGQSAMSRKHREESQYSWDSNRCYACHRDGRGEDD